MKIDEGVEVGDPWDSREIEKELSQIDDRLDRIEQKLDRLLGVGSNTSVGGPGHGGGCMCPTCKPGGGC